MESVMESDEAFLLSASHHVVRCDGIFFLMTLFTDRCLAPPLVLLIHRLASLCLFVCLFKHTTSLPPSLACCVLPRFTLALFRPYVVFRSTPPAIGCILQLTRGDPLPPP